MTNAPASQIDSGKRYERKIENKNALSTFLVIIAANIAFDLGLMPKFQSYLVAYVVVALVEYWIPPRPPMNFLT